MSAYPIYVNYLKNCHAAKCNFSPDQLQQLLHKIVGVLLETNAADEKFSEILFLVLI